MLGGVRPRRPRRRQLCNSTMSESEAHFETPILGSGHEETGDVHDACNISRIGPIPYAYLSQLSHIISSIEDKKSIICFQLDAVKMEVLLRNFDLVIDNGWNSIG